MIRIPFKINIFNVMFENLKLLIHIYCSLKHISHQSSLINIEDQRKN